LSAAVSRDEQVLALLGTLPPSECCSLWCACSAARVHDPAA